MNLVAIFGYPIPQLRSSNGRTHPTSGVPVIEACPIPKRNPTGRPTQMAGVVIRAHSFLTIARVWASILLIGTLTGCAAELDLFCPV